MSFFVRFKHIFLNESYTDTTNGVFENTVDDIALLFLIHYSLHVSDDVRR